jgi:hypothetical protein
VSFALEEVLWVSSHADLLGDPRLGPEQPQRFLPTRFDVRGNALDAKGFPCQTLACPRCHLPVPRALLETEPFFVSILGTPACGKSYYLTAMTWELRRLLPLHFGLGFTDADPAFNRSLNEYEESLFLNPHGDDLVPLADLIRKTELQGELYDTVLFGNQSVSYPRPFLFAVQPQAQHPNHAGVRRLARVLCLYDNAGEHFLAGQDSTSSPVTHHLARSRLLLFLFDPLQDQRFRKRCEQRKLLRPPPGARGNRQESVLLEAAARVRRHTGLSQNARHPRPLIVVLTKFDAWSGLLDDPSRHEPLVRQCGLLALDLDRVKARSEAARRLMLELCPEVVGAAESFARHVVYVPVSALGHAPVGHPETGQPAIRPRDILPIWVTVPLLFALAGYSPGLVASVRRQPGPEDLEGVSPRAGGPDRPGWDRGPTS